AAKNHAPEIRRGSFSIQIRSLIMGDKYGGSEVTLGKKGVKKNAKETIREGPGSGAGVGSYGAGEQRGYGNGNDNMADGANSIKVGMRWPNENFANNLRGGAAYEG